MTQKQRLAQLKALRNPETVTDEALSYLASRIEGVDIVQEVPQKGVDYYTQEDVDAIVAYVQSQVTNGIPGEDGLPGPAGENGSIGLVGASGYAPVRGTDYWTAEDKEVIITEALKRVKVPQDGKKGKDADIDEVVAKATEELAKAPFNIKKILNDPQLRMLLHGGGVTQSNVVQALDISKTFTYNADGTLNVVSSAIGTKTMVYTAGVLTSVVGTGAYKSKVLTYNGSGKLTITTVTQ